MSFNRISASLLQSAAQKLISLDAQASSQLAAFDDKVILVEIDDFNVRYYISFNKGQIKISESHSSAISAAIKGQSSAFIAAATSQHRSDAIFKGELHFTGEIATAQKFQSFVQSLEIDWQEPIAKVFGDPLGHTLSQGLKSFSGWLIQTGNSMRQDASEYLQEEAKVAPSLSEQQLFFDQVDQIRSKTDRLNARIARLNQTSKQPDNATTSSDSNP